MLEVTTTLGVTNPQITRGTAVIVRDGYGNAIAFIVESSEHTTSIYTCNDGEKFKEVAKHLGINNLAVCDQLKMDDWAQSPTAKLVL